MSLIANWRHSSGAGRSIRLATWLVTLLLGVLHGAVQALPGDLDATFGAGGLAQATVGNSVAAAAQQRDGRIVTVGRCASPASQYNFCITRFEADGSYVSSTPNVLGHRVWHHSDPAGSANPYAVAVDAQDRIVVGGSCSTAATGSDFCLLRLLPDGQIDTTFGGNNSGEVITPVSLGSYADEISALLIQPDGRIVAGGYCIRNAIFSVGFCLARYLPDGSLDREFGVQGIAVGHYTPGQASAVNLISAMVLAPGGEIYAVGSCDVPSLASIRMCAMKFAASGAMPVPAVAFDNRTSTTSRGYAIKLQPDGNLLIGGACYSGASTGWDFCLIRTSPTFMTDLKFADGERRMSLGYSAEADMATTMTLQTDGRIVLAGYCMLNPATSSYAFCWARYMANGEPDRSIHTNTDTTGAIITKFGAGKSQDFATTALSQPDGSLIVAGSCETGAFTGVYRPCVAKYQGGPFSYVGCSPDIDGDGKINPMVDGLIMSRIAAGMRDSAVMQGIRVPAGARRSNWNNEDGIAYYLQRACGVRGLSYSGFFTGF